MTKHPSRRKILIFLVQVRPQRVVLSKADKRWSAKKVFGSTSHSKDAHCCISLLFSSDGTESWRSPGREQTSCFHTLSSLTFPSPSVSLSGTSLTKRIWPVACVEGGCCVSQRLRVNPRSDLRPTAGLHQDQQGMMGKKFICRPSQFLTHVDTQSSVLYEPSNWL